MNGDVNGTMTEPMETGLLDSLANKDNQVNIDSGTTLESDGDVICDTKIQLNACNSVNNEIKKCPSGDVVHEDVDNGINENIIVEKFEHNDGQDEILEPVGHPNESISNNSCNSNSDSKTPQEIDTHEEVQDVEVSEKEKNNIESVDDNEQSESNIQMTVNKEYIEESISTEEEASAMSDEHKIEETLSINSESGSDCELSSNHNQCDSKINDVIVLDEDNRAASNSPDIQEIMSDNDNAEENTKSALPEDKVQLRRSSRTIKRKRYNDEVENGEESEEDEINCIDLKPHKMKPIVINDTKALVAMAAKQMKAYQGNSHKKEPTVVIIDTNSTMSVKSQPQPVKNSQPFTNATISAQNLYQSIVARGTTVTPISNKNITQVSQNIPTLQNSTPPILPSLTDDMFVVEAPSFIVPYVYEKPSVKPFREFVDKLGKELEEQKLRDEEKEKEKKEKEKRECQEKGEDCGPKDISDSKPEEVIEEDVTKKKKSKKERKRRQNEDDDDSWDGESASDSDDEVLSDVDDKIVVKEKIEPLDQINSVTELTVDKIVSNKSNGMNSMDSSLGKFFINIGLNLVQEYVQTDLLKQQNRKLYREKKGGHSTQSTESSIAQLMKNLEFSKENNAPYAFAQNKCEFCSFKTESKLVMAQHLETPHMKNNIYKCNFCTFEIRSPHDILYHMEVEHNIRGKLERAPSYHQCANCPFEDNGKGKLARHLIACAKKFKPESNLAPPVDWEPPAKIPKIAKPRNHIMNPYQNTFNRGQTGTTIRGAINISGIGSTITPYRPRGRSPMTVPPRNPPVHGIPIIRGPSMLRHNVPSAAPMPNSYQISNHSKSKSMHQPSISITPLPRQPQPIQQPQTPNASSNKSTFVICEICDGYIKDLEQLRNHMQWIHKVKIHPKMIYNRPPLNCQKCQFRFFTDQGLERHLLGSHGLVTSSMQEAANKGKDAGRCPVCGRVYQWKLLNHVARDHNLTLKPAHLSYKCTVCTATFGMYKQFENHVYSAHSVVAKKVIDKSKTNTSTKGTSDTLLKPLKINDEITIIPQPIKPMTPTSTKDK